MAGVLWALRWGAALRAEYREGRGEFARLQLERNIAARAEVPDTPAPTARIEWHAQPWGVRYHVFARGRGAGGTTIGAPRAVGVGLTAPACTVVGEPLPGGTFRFPDEYRVMATNGVAAAVTEWLTVSWLDRGGSFVS